MKKQVVFIHGGQAFQKYEDFLTDLRSTEIEAPLAEPQKRWHKDLAKSFGDKYEVYRPSMPNSDNSKYLEWKIWFERHFEFFRDGIILIGHSQGGMFLTKYLIENKLSFSVKALFLVGSIHDCYVGFNGSLDDGGDFGFDVEKLPVLQDRVESIFIVHSKDDFVVPYEQGEKLAKSLQKAQFVTFEDKNHFLIPEFPELLAKIRQLS